MSEASGSERMRRTVTLVAALAVLLIGLGLGFAWTAAATGDRPGDDVGVSPVIDDGPLESPTPSPAPSPAVAHASHRLDAFVPELSARMAVRSP